MLSLIRLATRKASLPAPPSTSGFRPVAMQSRKSSISLARLSCFGIFPPENEESAVSAWNRWLLNNADTVLPLLRVKSANDVILDPFYL